MFRDYQLRVLGPAARVLAHAGPFGPVALHRLFVVYRIVSRAARSGDFCLLFFLVRSESRCVSLSCFMYVSV